jgi:hypothetical protein
MKTKKGLLTLSLGMLALILTSCGNDISLKEQKIEFTMDVVDAESASVITASMRDNIIKIRQIKESQEHTSDISKLYTGNLSIFANAQSTKFTSQINIYDNNCYSSESTSSQTMVTANKIKTSDERKANSTVWFDSLSDGSLNNYAIYKVNKSYVGGQLVQDNGSTLGTRLTSDTPSDYFTREILNKEIFSNINYMYQNITNGNYDVYTDGTKYYIYQETTSKSSDLENPAYPKDTTKWISTYYTSQELMVISYDSSKGYYLSQTKTATDTYALKGFDENTTYKDPILISSSIAEANYSYDSLGKATPPTPYKGSNYLETPYLLTYLTTSIMSSNNSMDDVTSAYKRLNPEETASKIYFTSYYLNTNSYYSFGYYVSSSAGQSLTSKDGYSKITGRLNTIAEVESYPMLFKVNETGTYNIYAFKGSDGAMTYKVTYLM